jgi:hypothetical protein
MVKTWGLKVWTPYSPRGSRLANSRRGHYTCVSFGRIREFDSLGLARTDGRSLGGRPGQWVSSLRDKGRTHGLEYVAGSTR